MVRSNNANSQAQVEREIGSFELRLLAAIKRLGDQAWGSKLQGQISQSVGRQVAVSQLYVALARLERDGFISFDQTNPEPVRGGRSKKVFRLEASGIRALEKMAVLFDDPGALPPKESLNGQLVAA